MPRWRAFSRTRTSIRLTACWPPRRRSRAFLSSPPIRCSAAWVSVCFGELRSGPAASRGRSCGRLCREQVHIDVDDVDACLRSAVARSGMPRTISDSGILHVADREATPLASGRQARTALSCELEGENLLLPVLVAQHVRAELPVIAAISAGHLLASEDC